MRDSRVRWGHALTTILAVVLVQVTVFDRYQPLEAVRVDVPLVLIVAVGFVATPSDAAILGFTTGILLDTMQFGPFGLSALVYCLAAWLIVMARLRVLQPGATFRTVQGATIVVLVTGATWAAGTVFGLRPPEFGLESIGRLLLAGAIGAALVHPLTHAASWMVDDHDRSLTSSAMAS
ncbi:MAG: rod shape-determining protein MreD [Acidimicrobiales bacterium]